MTAANEISLGKHTTLLFGPDHGKYPSGNPVLVRGPEQSLVIDAALGVPIPDVDLVLLSHFHEDHTCGLTTRTDLPVHIHANDLNAVSSLEGFGAAIGYEDLSFQEDLREKFQHGPITHATTFDDDAVFDLGGDVRVRVVPLFGHTFGHCGFFIEPDGIFFTADIDLSSFGPYYGDVESSLGQMRTAIEACKDVDAHVYSTYHHKAFVKDRDEFDRNLAGFSSVIRDREERILAMIDEYPTLDSIVGNGVVYRTSGRIPSFALKVERRMVEQHLNELVGHGRLQPPDESGRYRR